MMNRFGLQQAAYWRGFGTALGAAAFLAGCASGPSPIPVSRNHLQAEPQAAEKDAGIPAPVKTGAFVPPPKPSVKPQTYSVVVNEVPVKELLFALARDTKLNIDIHPSIQGLVTMNAVNEPLDAILDRLSQQVNLRYKVEGNTLSITPDTPYLKTYRVDYVNLSRNTSSNIGVSSQIAGVGTSAAGGTTAGAAGTGVAGNNSSTAVKSASDNNFWEIMADNLRHILSATRSVASSAEEKAARAEFVRAEREDRLRQAEAVARAGSGAPALFSNVFGSEKPLSILGDVKEQVIVNPVAGSVSVLGTERQHKLVKEYLASVTSSARRQVLIEATIVEVGLKDQFHAGVDWTSIGRATGFNIKSVANAKDNLAGNLASFFSIGYSNANHNLTATLNLLESFGTTRILSSPKIMAINNQTALLKVVNNEVYFSIEVQQGTTSSAGTVLTPTVYTTTPHTVPVGVVMSVTPQISEGGVVSMTVRPTISRITEYKNDPNPDLAKINKDLAVADRIQNQVPVVQVREMESVLQVNSGQTIIMGGLMQDDIARGRDGLPVLSRPDGWGAIFGQQERKAAQTELVIFLRPTIITNASLDSDELASFRRFLPDPKAAAQP
ncbi:MAG: Type II secretory pathway component PulD [Nitrosomonadales bacterium]|nr:MAG: Type II secretory pathway component PulD [Nitrosomonadales bacterium]